MKRILCTVAVALAACVLAFGLTRWLGGSLTRATDAGDAMAWLQKEFDLTSAQAGAIRELHAAYEPVCAEHCLRIQEARTKLAGAADPAARALVQAELDQLTQTCRDNTRAHLRQVAARMSPEQGRRFLALTEPRLATTEHDQPLGLR